MTHFISRSQIRTRALIEQVNGQLKQKFRCLLGQGLPFKPPKACMVICACCVLFNHAKQLGETDDVDDTMMDEEEDDMQNVSHETDVNGALMRSQIVATFQ